MSDCKHLWRKIEAKGDGIVECTECGQRWRGAGAEFVWQRAKDALADLERRLKNMNEALDREFKLIPCDTCGALFPREGSKHGLNINGNYVCYACAPDWFEKVGNRFTDERDRDYARMMLARWLARYCYYNPHTAPLYRALEAEVTYVLKQEGRLSYAVQ
jgi:hypothetical protein